MIIIIIFQHNRRIITDYPLREAEDAIFQLYHKKALFASEMPNSYKLPEKGSKQGVYF